MRTRIGFMAGAALVALLVIGALSVASGSSRGHLRMWGLQPGVAPHTAAVAHAEGTTQVVVFTRNEHSVDVDEPPAGLGEKLPVAPVGRPLTDMVRGDVKPPVRVIVTV